MAADLNTAFAALLREAEPPRTATNEERARAAADRIAAFDVSTLRLRRGDDE
jgi:hypothetical protein